MTDPATDLGEIIVTGNRRPAGTTGPFGGSAGGAGDGNGPHQRELDPDGEGGGGHPSMDDACATAEGRLEKAADSVAAQAVALFDQLARLSGEDGLNYRERGAYLFLNPDGSVTLGPISVGDPFAYGGVGTTGNLDLGGRDPATVIGSIHSHGVGNFLPSTGPGGGGDRGHFWGMVNMVAGAGGNASQVRMYIAAQTTPPADVPAYNAIHYYDQNNLEGDIQNGSPSVEVDPNGQPCP